MEVFNSRVIDELLNQAIADPRKRKARALKPGDYTGVRPLLNAMLPGTYIQPHRHNLENADEYWFTLKGNIAAFSFREDGKILVFNKYEVAKKYADQLNGFVCKIMSINYYPAHRKSHLHGKKYKKIGW